MSRRRVYFVIPVQPTMGTFQAIVNRESMAWLHKKVRIGLFRVIKIERYRND